MKDATVQEAEKPIICLLGSFNPGERSQEIADPFGVSKVALNSSRYIRNFCSDLCDNLNYSWSCVNWLRLSCLNTPKKQFLLEDESETC